MASLDFYNGQSVNGIEMYGDEDFEWCIRFSGGAIVKNWDRRRTAVPEVPEGLGLLMVVLEESATTMKFGVADPATGNIVNQVEVVLTPTQYSITDPNYAIAEEFPQANTQSIVQEVTYPNELLAREADGPENQEGEIATEEVEDSEGAGSADEGDTGEDTEGN